MAGDYTAKLVTAFNTPAYDDFFATDTIENGAAVPMTWYITPQRSTISNLQFHRVNTSELYSASLGVGANRTTSSIRFAQTVLDRKIAESRKSLKQNLKTSNYLKYKQMWSDKVALANFSRVERLKAWWSKRYDKEIRASVGDPVR